MSKRMKRSTVLPETNRKLRNVIIAAWFLPFVLLVPACGRSTESLPLPTTIPSTPPAGYQPPSRPVELPLSQYLRFGHITSEDGLSNNAIWGIAQDRHGFMWIGTYSGLNRYDGSSFKVYRHDPDDPYSLSADSIRGLIVDQNGVLWIGTWDSGVHEFDQAADRFIRYQHNPEDPHSLSNDSIRTIYEGRDGSIWVGTLGGLNQFDPSTKGWTQFLHDPDDPDSLGNNIVWSVFEDNSGMLWIGTDGGLDRFDPGTEKFVHYRHDPDDPNSISHNSVRSIFKDATGTLWVGTMGGLNRFNPETGKVTRYQHDSDNPDSLINNVVYMVYEDQGGALWVGTWGGGLDRFDRETETFIHYKENPADLFSISASSVFLMYEDQSGMVWIATEDGGINTLDPGAKPFRHYRAIPGTPNSLNENGVRSLFVDKAGIVWVGTTGGGLNRFDPQTEEFTQYRYDPDDPNSLSNDSVFAIHEDHEGVLWIGGFGSGLNGFDKNTETFTHYKYDPNDPHSLSNNSIIAIHEDQSGILWIGTWGGGVNAFDREKEQFTRYEPDPEDSASLSQSQVHAILEDQRGVIWIGTLGGLNRFDRETGTFTRYQHDPNDPNSIGSNSVATLYEDQSGNFWVGGAKGLDLFNRENEQFTHYTVHDGLPSDIVWGILEDDQGILWLSTTNGLSRFEPHTETFRNYYVSDGLQSDSFLEASDKNQSGELFFGGTNGFNAFNPNQITDNPFVPNVQITDFQLANKPVPVSSDSLLKKSILETDHLVLSNLDRIFSFEFAALNYRSPEKNRYKYKMEGFEEDWNEVDSTRRFATYTNLDPGDYIFRVIASNNDGIWNEEGASINITVTPPWWETVGFRIAMVVLVIGLLVGGYRRRAKSFEARTRELETQVEERTQELKTAKEGADEARAAAEIANQAKSTFLANMSHELRTPLNTILGFSRMLARDPGTSARQNEMLDIINRSGEHLLSMVDDVLSLSRIEAGRVELNQETFTLTQMLADIGRIFKSRAEGKGLQFSLELDPSLSPNLLGDSGKLRQVLTNLLENAVKYTQEGDIWLRAGVQPIPQDPSRVVLQLEVEDTGPGIPRDQLESVFEAFVQVEGMPKGEGGTGLGLTISKSLVEIMGGEMVVESGLGEGTQFRIRIPMGLTEAVAAVPGEELAAEVVGLQPGQSARRILVVDDNRENRMLLTNLIAPVGFKVKEAINGQEAIALFKDWRPDFIWMDMRMPVMDGYAATKEIRSLPGGEMVRIVAVTASVLDEQRDEILASGCDDLVSKPFRDHEIFDVMADQLGAKYLYKEGLAVSGQPQSVTLTFEMLAELPPELRQELEETTLALNREATLEVIQRIEEHAPDTAAGLRALVKDLEMGRIRELLRDTGE